MACSMITPANIEILKEKACKSACTYKVSAMAFDKKGDLLGHTVNRHSQWDVLTKDGEGRPGTAEHAERRLISTFGKNIKTILIARVGHSGILRPIDPCPACSKLARKYGIKIISISDLKV